MQQELKADETHSGNMAKQTSCIDVQQLCLLALLACSEDSSL
jgi:hypothetical protein